MSKKNILEKAARYTDLLQDELVINSIPKLDNEEWVKVNRDLYPELKPYYWISNKGRIFSSHTNKILKPRCLNINKSESPYYKIQLQIEYYGKSFDRTYLIHRLELSSFNPVENMNRLFVNHKDGNKLNNDLSNLEWTTASENAIHAIKMGLFKPTYGESHACAKITEKDAKHIIDLLLQHKYYHKEIANIVGTTIGVVDSIASKSAWRYLTKDIPDEDLTYRLPKRFSFNDIKKCCEFFETTKIGINESIRSYCIKAIKSIGIHDYTEGMLNSVRLLYQKQRYQEISSAYNF